MVRDRINSAESRIVSFTERIDTFLSTVSTQERDRDTNELVNEDMRRQEFSLRSEAFEFVSRYSDGIIGNALGQISEPDISRLKKGLEMMDELTAAEFLLGIRYTGDASALASAEFMDNLRLLDPYVANSLLYEIRLTGNHVDLTDDRLFKGNGPSFFNRLGPEAASEWFNSIGSTGNVSALTSDAALSDFVIEAVNGDAAIASELSYAIGRTDNPERLASPQFLSLLSEMDASVATEYLSAIWCTKRVEEMATGEIARMVGTGKADVWKDVVRLFNSNDLNSETIIISMAGDGGHDRGAKLTVESLMSSGFDTIYVGSVQNPEELIEIAKREDAQAIGFSISLDTDQSIIIGAIAEARAAGLDGISFFGGGMITSEMAQILESAGTTVFAPGASQSDLVSFLKPQSVIPGIMPHEGSYLSAPHPGNAETSAAAILTGASISYDAHSTLTCDFGDVPLGKTYTSLMESLFRMSKFGPAALWTSNPAQYSVQEMEIPQRDGKPAVLILRTVAPGTAASSGVNLSSLFSSSAPETVKHMQLICTEYEKNSARQSLMFSDLAITSVQISGLQHKGGNGLMTQMHNLKCEDNTFVNQRGARNGMVNHLAEQAHATISPALHPVAAQLPRYYERQEPTQILVQVKAGAVQIMLQKSQEQVRNAPAQDIGIQAQIPQPYGRADPNQITAMQASRSSLKSLRSLQGVLPSDDLQEGARAAIAKQLPQDVASHPASVDIYSLRKSQSPAELRIQPVLQVSKTEQEHAQGERGWSVPVGAAESFKLTISLNPKSALLEPRPISGHYKAQTEPEKFQFNMETAIIGHGENWTQTPSESSWTVHAPHSIGMRAVPAVNGRKRKFRSSSTETVERIRTVISRVVSYYSGALA